MATERSSAVKKRFLHDYRLFTHGLKNVFIYRVKVSKLAVEDNRTSARSRRASGWAVQARDAFRRDGEF